MAHRSTVALSVLVAAVLMGAAGVVAIDMAYRDNVDIVSRVMLDSTASAFQCQIDAHLVALDSVAVAVASDPGVASLMDAEDSRGLVGTSAKTFESLRREHGITHWYYEQTAAKGGKVIARVHDPELKGDVLTRITYRLAVTEGHGSGLELGRTAFALRVVRPVHDADDKHVGFVELGRDVTGILRDLKRVSGHDYALVVDKGRMGDVAEQQWDSIRSTHPEAGRWRDHPSNLLIDITDTGHRPWMGRIPDLPRDGEVLGTEWIDRRAIVTAAFPIDDAAGARIGAVVAFMDVTEAMKRMQAEQIRVSVLMIAAVIVVGAVLMLFLDRLHTGGARPRVASTDHEPEDSDR